MLERIIIKNYKGIKHADIKLNEKTNILVGNNGVGKSTVIEAISLALGYGLNQLEITPFLFHNTTWVDFENDHNELPEISIELFFQLDPKLSTYKGKNNSLKEEHLGLRLRFFIDEEYKNTFKKEIQSSKYIPCEYYKFDRLWFSDEPVRQLTLPYSIKVIDSTTTYFNTRTNQFVGRLINEKLSEDENIILKSCLSSIKATFEESERITELNNSLNSKVEDLDKIIALSVNLTSKNAWNTILHPSVDKLPIEQIGQGDQCILKTMLCLNSNISENKKSILVIEEPESHLSHTKLYELLNLLEGRTEQQQLIITTHNNFVANRLNLENIKILNNNDGVVNIAAIDRDNIENDSYLFFTKVCHYPTLRLALCKKAILIEGPTDEMIVQYYYEKEFNKHPFSDGIELISVDGVSFTHYIELAKSLNVKVAVITDNDKKTEADIKRIYNKNNLEYIGVFTEPDVKINTLEPSFVHKNIDRINDLANIIRIKRYDDETKDTLADFMIKNKTTWACRLLENRVEAVKKNIEVPDYIINAIKWIKND